MRFDQTRFVLILEVVGGLVLETEIRHGVEGCARAR